MAEQARGEDFQREGQVARVGKGGSGGGECVRLFPGEQVESRRCFFRAARVKSLSVWLPVSGALVVEPGDVVITGDQVRHDRGGVIAQQGWQMVKVQGVREPKGVFERVQRQAAAPGLRAVQERRRLARERY